MDTLIWKSIIEQINQIWEFDNYYLFISYLIIIFIINKRQTYFAYKNNLNEANCVPNLTEIIMKT